MVKKSPLISILVCNYNYDKYIKDSLESALAQDYQNIEIIAIDDGSTDDSVSVIEKLRSEHPQSKFSIKAKAKNEGLCRARNDAIDLAGGEYFVFLDSDDTMPPEYISSLYAVAVKEQADVVYGDVELFGSETGKSNAPDYDPSILLLDNYINISCLVKRARIKDHRFDIKLNRKSHEDYDFWVGLSLLGLKFVKAKGVYLNYRIQSHSRNSNTIGLELRTVSFIHAWKYVIEKYRKQFPIPDDIFFKQLLHQVGRLSAESTELNNIIQKELNPELKKREEHIAALDNRIADIFVGYNLLQEERAKNASLIEVRLGRALRRTIKNLKFK